MSVENSSSSEIVGYLDFSMDLTLTFAFGILAIRLFGVRIFKSSQI